jgi:hypothetical protein
MTEVSIRPVTKRSKGAVCVAVVVAAACRPTQVTTRVVAMHSPATCTAAGASLGPDATAQFLALGDFDPPQAPVTVHRIGDVGAVLSEVDPASRALVVDALQSDRDWLGVAGVPPQGNVDVLLLPALSSCPLPAAVMSSDAAPGRAGSSMALVAPDQVMIVGGAPGDAMAPLPPTYVVRMGTGAVAVPDPDLLKPRVNASVTVFGTMGLVAGGFDANASGMNPLDSAEVYDPALGRFDREHTVQLSEPRADHGAVVLAGGETLLVGGVGSAGQVLSSMEVVDPTTRAARATNVARLTIARRAPTVLRLASGEILVAGGVDQNMMPVATLEWFAADVAVPSRSPRDLVAGSARSYTALQAGGALAVIAPTPGAPPGFQNVWMIDPDGALEAAAPIEGALTRPHLFGGAGGSPALWTGDRWLRWQPWAGSFGLLGVLDDAVANVGELAASADPGLAMWSDGTSWAPVLLRFDTRGPYSSLHGPVFLLDTADSAPDRLPQSGAVAFDATLGLALGPGASAFVTDRTYADVQIDLDAPTGEPAAVILRGEGGSEIEVGGQGCPGAAVAGTASSIRVRRKGAQVDWARLPGPDTPCPMVVPSEARFAVGVRTPENAPRSVVRNLRVQRLGAP